MSGVKVGAKPRHPENKSLSEALKEDADRIKAQKGLIDKTATLIKAPDDESDANGDTGATMRPTDEQLAAINGFTRKTVTADEVVAFTTLSCNDIVDRDDDKFTTQCVKDFKELEQPFSPVGKSFMLDHAYKTENAVGRIFGVDTKKVSGALFLTNEVYMPNTEQFAPLIEKIDFGINWAVSVGVMLGKSECSVCKSPFSSWGYWCQEGHDKGYFYDPKSEETDSWGYPVPCDPDTKGAIKCVREFSEPRDMYELSQVFLGAQYFAALEKEPDFASVMKSVSDAGIPTIGLSAKEAEDIPFRHEPKQVSEARRQFGVKAAEDGSLVWTDDSGLRWTFDPATPSDGVLSLGKSTNEDSEEENDGEHEVPGGPGSDEGEPVAGADAPEPDAEAGLGGSGSGSDHPEADGEQQRGVAGSQVELDADESEDDEDADPESEDEDDNDEDSDSEDSDEDTSTEEDKSVTKKAVLAAAKKAGLPNSVIDVAKEAAGTGLEPILVAVGKEIEELRTEVTGLEGKAALGDLYLKDLRAQAIDWYTKAHQNGQDEGVSTTTFERLLDKCGDDVDLIKSLSDEQRDVAQAKFPKSVRRSSFPSDPNGSDREETSEKSGEPIGGDTTGSSVRRIHG